MEDKLISEVYKYPNLYDQNLHSYKDSELKNLIWAQIAGVILGDTDPESVEKIKTRWKSLRDSFLRSLKKSGTPGHKKSKPWKYSEHMQFLLPYVGSRGQTSRDDFYEDNGSEYMQNGDTSQDFVDGGNENVDDGLQSNGLEDRKSKKRTYDDKPVRRLKSTSNITLNCLPNLCAVDSFFLGIAQTVKRLTPVNQALVKKAVANIVIDTETSELEEHNGWIGHTNIYEPRVDLIENADKPHCSFSDQIKPSKQNGLLSSPSSSSSVASEPSYSSHLAN